MSPSRWNQSRHLFCWSSAPCSKLEPTTRNSSALLSPKRMYSNEHREVADQRSARSSATFGVRPSGRWQTDTSANTVRIQSAIGREGGLPVQHPKKRLGLHLLSATWPCKIQENGTAPQIWAVPSHELPRDLHPAVSDLRHRCGVEMSQMDCCATGHRWPRSSTMLCGFLRSRRGMMVFSRTSRVR